MFTSYWNQQEIKTARGYTRKKGEYYRPEPEWILQLVHLEYNRLIHKSANLESECIFVNIRDATVVSNTRNIKT